MVAKLRTWEEQGQGVLAVNARGCIQWASNRTRRLLVAYGLLRRSGRGALAGPLRAWLRARATEFDGPKTRPHPAKLMAVKGPSGRLLIRVLRQGASRILFLNEQRTDGRIAALAALGLSPRETEVLSWVVEGKSNPEIGVILGISERTVQKHLERVYPRLGVESRHAAMRVAWQTVRAKS